MALVGAVDAAVAREPALASTIERFYPRYHQPDTAGWFANRPSWVGPESIPTVGDALAVLSEAPSPGGLDGARRLVAVAALASIVDHVEVATDDLVAALAPLTPQGLKGGELFTVVTETLTGVDAWETFIHDATGAGLLTASIAAQDEPPCSASLIPVVVDGDEDPALCITTSHVVARSLSELDGYLNPANWGDCSSLWCSMTPVSPMPAGMLVYDERVGLECPNGPAISARLAFGAASPDPQTRVLEYSMHDPQPPLASADTNPVVDEGWIVCTALDAASTRVETSKVVKFGDPVEMDWLPWLICAAGWGDAAYEHIMNCATDPASPPPPEPFVTTPTPTEEITMSDSFKTAVDAYFAAAKQCLDESAALWSTSAATAETAGSAYTADQATQQLADMVTLGLKHVATMWGEGLKVAAAAATLNPGSGPPPP